jgi:PTS system cellobiose-specific IIC component
LPPGSLASFEAFAANLGTSGLFTAIVCCLAVAAGIELGRARLGGQRGVVLGALAVCLFAALLAAVHVSLGALLDALVSPLGRLGDTFLALFLITGIETALFLFGVHGPALLAALVLPVYLRFQFHNTAAWVHHEPMPYLVTVSTFLFVFPGGTGATLPLVLLLLRSRVPHLRRMAFATLVPSVFNVNEPLIFGLPIVYNPILGLPYVLAPLALVGTTYAALAFGLVRRTIYYIPTPVPMFLNVFLATLDWHAIVLLAINLLVAGLIYFPFVRMYERTELARK